MKAVIFGGTTEGRDLSLALANLGADVVVSVASDYGVEEQGMICGVTVAEGRKDKAAIRELIRGADLVIDATHPYAVVVTENIRQAASAEDIELLRLVRDRSELPESAQGTENASSPRTAPEEDGRLSAGAEQSASDTPGAPAQYRIVVANDAAETAQLALQIAGPEGRVLLTTGSKDLPIYAEVLDPEHLYPRVLPLIGSIEACEQCGIPHRNIIAIQGPFSEELNQAVLRDYGIDVMVTKESGRSGGFLEKIRSCERCGIPAIVIARPPEDGMSFEEVLAACRERIETEAQTAEGEQKA